MKIVDWLENFGIENIGEVGGKNGSLGEMIRNISKLGIRVPNGYVITTEGFKKYLEYNNISKNINEILGGIDYDDHVALKRSGLKIRNLIQNGNFPEDIEKEILLFYSNLSSNYKDSEGRSQNFTDVAIRSSSTAEDLPEASFAGQQETYLNIRGPQQVIDSIKNCFSSLFTDRAISYRHKINFPQTKVSISVCVQKMVRSDLGSAGVVFTVDPDSGFKDVVIINGSWGLGEMVVGGSITPDEFVLYKPNLKKGIDSILDKKLVIEGLIKNHRMFQKIFKDVEFKFYFVKPKSIKDFGERIINRVVENPANYGRLFYLEKEDKLTEREGLNDFIKNGRNGKLFIKLVEETAKKNYKKIDELLDYFNSICSGIEVISV